MHSCRGVLYFLAYFIPMKLRPVDTSGWTSCITEYKTLLIPDELLQALNWKPYTHVDYEVKEGSLIIRKAPSN